MPPPLPSLAPLKRWAPRFSPRWTSCRRPGARVAAPARHTSLQGRGRHAARGERAGRNGCEAPAEGCKSVDDCCQVLGTWRRACTHNCLGQGQSHQSRNTPACNSSIFIACMHVCAFPQATRQLPPTQSVHVYMPCGSHQASHHSPEPSTRVSPMPCSCLPSSPLSTAACTLVCTAAT